MSAIRGICGSASALLVCFAAACGGGGSSGQGGDFGTGLSIDTTTVSFSGATSEPARPASQSLHATISASDAASIEVGYANGAEQVSWLQVTIPAGQNPASTAINFTVTPQPTPGTYTAHPSVAIFKADRTPIALRALTVTYQVTPAPPSVSPPAITTQMAAANVGGPFGDIFVKGTGTWTATVDYLFGYDATAHVIEDWMYERVTEVYVGDPATRKFFEQSNPWALTSIAEKLLEAADRGMWTAAPETLTMLRRAVLEAEGWEEGR